MLAGPPPSGGVGELGLGEQSLRQPRRALERPLEPIDLQQIDPDFYRTAALTQP
jgi:hypothetical protein